MKKIKYNNLLLFIFFFFFVLEDYDTKELEEQFQYQKKDSRTITRTIFYDYIKAGGWIPSLIYITIAIFCQILHVFIDFWLSQWTNEDFIEENHDVIIYILMI